MMSFFLPPVLRRDAFVLTILCCLMIAGAPFSASACSPAPDDRDVLARLNDRDVVFIGRVTDVTDEATTFLVEVPMRGVGAGQTTITLPNDNPPSTCTRKFVVGQHLLYAGGRTINPTYILP